MKINTLRNSYYSTENVEEPEKLMSFNRKVGELETKLLQLERPAERTEKPRVEAADSFDVAQS